MFFSARSNNNTGGNNSIDSHSRPSPKRHFLPGGSSPQSPRAPPLRHRGEVCVASVNMIYGDRNHHHHRGDGMARFQDHGSSHIGSHNGQPLRRSMPRSASCSSIADEIRNDPDLFCGDSSFPTLSIVEPLSTSAASITATLITATETSAPLRTSHSSSRLDNLQREVDAALELFSQETVDDLDCDDVYHHFSGSDDFRHHNADSADDDDWQYKHAGHDSQDSNELSSPVKFGDEDLCHDDIYPPSLASTSLANSSDCGDFLDGSSNSSHAGGGGGFSNRHKARSLLSIPLSLLHPIRSSNCLSDGALSTDGTNTNEDHRDGEDMLCFGRTVNDELVASCGECRVADRNYYVDFDSKFLREAMEPFLAKARLQREEARRIFLDAVRALHCPHTHGPANTEKTYTIGSTFGIPYPSMRTELPFLYDLDSYPLDAILAQTLRVDDLSKLHLDHPQSQNLNKFMSPLHNRGKRRAFHRCYDAFVTSHVIPLLHSQALANDVFYTNRHQLRRGKPQRIVYRYQAFPSIRILRPGESDAGPRCDASAGHSLGNLSFHVPLTSTFGTNALHVESRAGREDWHALSARSGPGLGFRYDGAQCLRFGLENATDATSVALDFRIAIARAPDVDDDQGGGVRIGEDGDAISMAEEMEFDPDDQLCAREILGDKYSRAGPGYYEEVIVSVGDTPRSFLPPPVAMKRQSSGNKLFDPDSRVGFPFDSR